MKRKILRIIFLILLASGFAIGFGYYQFTDRVTGEYFQSNGTRIHYKVEGEGEPVVLIHGFAVNADLNWRKPGVIDYLSKNFKIIMLDLRGHGLSDKPHDKNLYGIEMVKDVVNLLDHLKIERAHLVGYSLGGFVALKAATLYPERWITVVPMASGWEDPQTSKGLQGLSQVSEDLKAGKSIGPIIGYFDDRKKPGMLHTIWVKILTTWFNDRDALMALVQSAADLGISEQELRAISNPVCSIIGSDDPFLKSANNITGKISDFELHIIEGEDHMTTPSKKETKQILKEYLGRIRRN